MLESLADAGPALTRSLGIFATYPWPKDNVEKWLRGDYANLTGVFDLTLSRIDAAFFTGTRWEGELTELELQWGRTIGQLPSPYTAGNPLTVPTIGIRGHDVPPLTRRIRIQLAIFAVIALIVGAVNGIRLHQAAVPVRRSGATR